MPKILDALAPLALTAWVGSLWAIGYLAVPILFHAQPDRQLAGMLAGEMFTAVGYLGIVCGSYLLMRVRFGRHPAPRPFWVIVSMLLITLLLQFGIQPMMTAMKTQVLPLDVMHSPLADRFKLWHGISSIAYLLQSLLGGYLLVSWKGRES